MAISPGIIANVAAQLAQTSKEAARALPQSKGIETPFQLQAYRTEIYSYFTPATGETELMYSAESWVRIKITLETAGPVAVGTASQISPVLSGRGRLLDTGVEFEAYLAKGTRFYIVSDTVNRMSVTIEPVPWLEQISMDVGVGLAGVRDVVSAVGSGIVNAIAALRGAMKPTSSSGKTTADLPCPPPPSGLLPRLTSIRGPRKIR